MKYLVVDASLSGTGIRDKYEGGYLTSKELKLSSDITNRLNDWLLKYESEHYKGFPNGDIVNKLDQEGKEIALIIKTELSKVKLEYFSDARMTSEML